MLNIKELKIDNFGMLLNSFIEDYEVNEKGIDVSSINLSVYIVIRTIFYNPVLNYSQFCLNDLYSSLSVNDEKSAQYKPIDNAIKWLVDNEYMTLYDVLGQDIKFDKKYKGSYIVTFAEVTKEEGFTKIPFINLLSILEYISKNKSNGFKKYQLIRYYLIIARACSNVEQFFTKDIDSINEILPISSNQCKKNNEILHNLGCIYYNNEYVQITRDGRPKNESTMFGHRNNIMKTARFDGMYMTEEIFNCFVREKVDGRKTIVKIDKVKSNNKRSETMKKVWADRKSKETQVEQETIKQAEVPTLEDNLTEYEEMCAMQEKEMNKALKDMEDDDTFFDDMMNTRETVKPVLTLEEERRKLSREINEKWAYNDDEFNNIFGA